MVPRRGLEPPRPCERQHLKLVRLPIPPSGHGVGERLYGAPNPLSTAPKNNLRISSSRSARCALARWLRPRPRPRARAPREACAHDMHDRQAVIRPNARSPGNSRRCHGKGDGAPEGTDLEPVRVRKRERAPELMRGSSHKDGAAYRTRTCDPRITKACDGLARKHGFLTFFGRIGTPVLPPPMPAPN